MLSLGKKVKSLSRTRIFSLVNKCMKKSILLRVNIGVIIIAIIIGFFMFYEDKNSSSNSISSTGNSNPETENAQQIQDNEDKSQENSEIDSQELIEICDKIVDSNYKNVCYALAKKDESYCENVKISSPSRTSYGADTCKFYVSEVKLMERGINWNETYSEWVNEKCEEIVADPNMSVSQKDRMLCTYTIAIEKDNPELCGKINDDLFKDDCFYELSISKKDPDLCEFIIDPQKKERCASLGEFGYDNQESCLKFNSWVDKADCLVYFAASSNDSDICMLDKGLKPTEAGIIKDYCYRKLTEKTKKSYCGKINDEYKRDLCWVFMGGVTGDSNICEEKALGTEYYGIKEDLEWLDVTPGRDDCYKWVAIYHRDISYCENAYYKDACYAGYVLEISKILVP
jgi:hypothetical protein